MMSKTVVFVILVVLSIASGNSQVQNFRVSSRKPQLFNVRKRHDMSSKPLILRIRTPSSNPSGRVLPPDLSPDMVRESSIVRIKPVIRFHHSDDVVHLSPLNETEVVSDQFHKDLKSMSLSTMSKLLKKTGLDKDILQVGTVTLFAPTDEAFSLGPRGLLEFLLEEEEEEKAGKSGDAKQKLRNFLLQHAIRGHLYPDSIRNDLTAKSLHPSGAPMRFNVYDGGQMISVSGSQFLGSPRLTGKDRILVQPIDKVLYPATEGTLLDKTRDLFPETHSLLIKAGLIDQLSSGTFTLLAPTNEAFSALPEKARDILLSNSTLLRKVMLNHVIPGTYFSTVLTNGYKLKSLSGPITFTTRRGLILANGVPIIKPDLPVTNGVIHALNRPLIPEELVEQCKCMSKYPLTPATLRPSPPPPHRKYPEADEKFSESGEHAHGFGVRLKALPSSYPSPPHQHGALSRPANRDRKPVNSTRSEPVESEDHDSQLEQLMQTPVILPDGRKLTFNTANQLFGRTPLIDKIRHPGPRGITILLPSDAAFSKLPPEHLEKLRRDPDRLKNTLEWHVLDQNLDPETLRSNARVKTLGGRTHIVKLMPDRKRFLIGGTPVLSVKRTSRGTIFAIDKVFDPPPEASASDKNFSTTSAALEQGPDNDLSIWRNIIDGLPEVRRYLKSKDRLYTMFAPTNGAFRQLSPENLQQVFADENLQKDLVWSHVMLGAYYRSALTPGMTLPTLGGSLLKFDLIPRGFVVNDLPVTRAGVVTSNGVIYIVDRLLVFPPPPTSYRSLDGIPVAEIPRRKPTLEDIALENDAGTFLKWIHASGLRDDIRNQRRCTIFLPTNNAISQMSPTLRMATMGNPKLLARFVRYHVCGDSFIKSREGLEKEDQKIPTMLPGKDIRCNVYKNRTVVTASGCPVSKVIPIPGNTDEEGISVVIVNKTLSPPVGDLFLTASKSPMLRNFTKIIKISGIDKELRNEDPLTIFAPIKCVFAKMPPDEYLKLITDSNAAKEFVKRYIVKGCIYTSGMTGGLKLTTLAGTTLKIDLPPDGCIRVNGAKLKYGDMAATNGVLHVVSEAL